MLNLNKLDRKLILLAGPTASGKSKLAIAIAKKIKGEIINADSMQIYKELSILSSRPLKKDLKKINHHLYGIISVKKHFSAGDWLKLVKKKIIECKKNNKIPIIVGGTGLYFNTITSGISKIPKIDKKTRNEVRELHKFLGPKLFYDRLTNIDPKIKNKILSSDTQRVLRAYEVKIKTKKSIYEWSLNTKSEFKKYDIRNIFLDIPRENLLKKIIYRTNAMIKKECIDEVKFFLNLKIDGSLSANKLIGVKELNDHLKGQISLEEAKKQIIIRTRQYAKRQNTWARGHMKNWNKLYSKDFSSLLKKTLKLIS